MEEEAGSRKRKEHDDGGADAAKAAKFIPEVPDAEGMVEMEEAAVAEVMKWLEEEMDSAALPPSPSSPSYRQETTFVTINGNEESCGPSFSSSASTVMASVDTSGCDYVPYFIGCPSDRAALPPAAPLIRTLAPRSAAKPVAEAADGYGAAAVEDDESEWVARVLGVGAALKVEESRV
ncbi:hypothetical protein GW17_00033715 [Ensete ventricosum]|nr:hypothetical protein GW17_00033715 [Ensete ventricosum]RZR76930.1 hypothetical protein BHM03_00001841 [Ensete ventricosum]